jgi:hypothetical protein
MSEHVLAALEPKPSAFPIKKEGENAKGVSLSRL